MPTASHVVARPGRGIGAAVDGHQVLVGNSRFLSEEGVALDEPALQSLATRWEAQGRSVIWVAVDQIVAMTIALEDPIKSEAKEAIAALRARGLQVRILSGDSFGTVRAVATQLGLHSSTDERARDPEAEDQDEKEEEGSEQQETRLVVAPAAASQSSASYQGGVADDGEPAALAQLSPADKADCVRRWQQAGHKVLVVGDGLNDAVALAQADVGMAVGAGVDVTREAAAVVLCKDSLSDVVSAVDLSRRAMSRIRLNFFWAFLYNAVGLALATGLLMPWAGVHVPPSLAGASEMLSSLPVILFSLALRW